MYNVYIYSVFLFKKGIIMGYIDMYTAHRMKRMGYIDMYTAHRMKRMPV